MAEGEATTFGSFLESDSDSILSGSEDEAAVLTSSSGKERIGNWLVRDENVLCSV